MLKLTRLKEARELAGLSQDELAGTSGVARATVADLELGKRMAQPRTARRLAEALEVEIRELLEEPTPPKVEAPSSPEPDEALEEERRLHIFDDSRVFVEDLTNRFEELSDLLGGSDTDRLKGALAHQIYESYYLLLFIRELEQMEVGTVSEGFERDFQKLRQSQQQAFPFVEQWLVLGEEPERPRVARRQTPSREEPGAVGETA